MKCALIVFARYPQPGKCKTRLIGELGEHGAAELQIRMTRHTLDWVRELCAQSERLGLEGEFVPSVCFQGAAAQSMSKLFGDDLSYRLQTDGDLGQKMEAAVRDALGADCERIVVVGTDCPELRADVVSQAFQRLATHDVCIVPAQDGGYALIGINRRSNASMDRLLQSLFEDIEWGTDRVAMQTAARLSELHAPTCLLPCVSDVDRPQDLPRALQALEGRSAPQPKISVIIPVFGSESQLDETIRSAVCEGAEIILSAARGPTTNALTVAASRRTQLLFSEANRGLQLNTAASDATADVLLFLHADTRLPPGYCDAILDCLRDERIVGGAFELAIDSADYRMRWVERGAQWRSKFLGLPYGDQAIFVRRCVFEELGGFRQMPIMEDYEFVLRLRNRGGMRLLKQSVTTSARRWKKLGPLRTTLKNQLMLAGYHLGVAPSRLARFYRD